MFGFIRWWRSKRDYGERTLAVMFLCIFAASASVPLVGMFGAMMVLLIGLLGTLLGMLLYLGYHALIDQIRLYKYELDRERQMIVDKLAGRR